MMKMLRILAVITVCLTIGGIAYANPYASKLSAPPTALVGGDATIDYFLNHEAEAVEVKIYDGSVTLVRTLDASEAEAAAQPGTATGANSVVWDTKDDGGVALAQGAYTYEVVASESVGYATWTKMAETFMYSPRGGRVNRDPNSPTYGLLYVANAYQGTSVNPGAIFQDTGVYIFNPDLTYAAGTTDGYADGNAPFVDNFNLTGCPWNVQFDEENSVYLCDWCATDPTVIKGDENFNNTFALLDDTAGSRNQFVVDLAFSGAGSNRVMYTIDDSYDFDSGDWYYGNFHTWQYDIGDTSTVYTSTPAKVIDSAPVWSEPMIFPWSLNIDGDTFYIGDYRDPGNGPMAYAVDVSSSKLTDGTPVDIIWSASNSSTVLSNISIGDLNDDGTLLTFGTRTNTTTGKVAIFNTSDGSVADHFLAHPDGSRTRCACWDPAGNLYSTNNIDEWIRLWAPPGPSSTTTPGPGAIVLQAVTGLESDHWSVFR